MLLLISMDAETANEITQLTQNLSNEVTKLEENKNTLSVIEEGIVNDKFSHIDKMNYLNDKYARKRLELISLIKPLSNRFRYCFFLFLYFFKQMLISKQQYI